MANFTNSTNTEHFDDLNSTLSFPEEAQDKSILSNTLIYILISTIVIYFFYRLFCKFVLNNLIT